MKIPDGKTLLNGSVGSGGLYGSDGRVGPKELADSNKAQNINNLPKSIVGSQQNVSAELPGKMKIPAGEFFAQAASTLGFPKDPLSIGILAFSRFFSHPLTQALMGTLRREILESGKLSAPLDEKGKAALEAETLVRIIALDKGVALSPEAMERLVYILAPQQPQHSDENKNKRKEGKQKEDSQDKLSRKEPGRKEADREEVPAAGEIKAQAGKQAKEDRLVDYLNAIPGKNGQYWMVYPFKIEVRGIELKIIIRLLKKELFSPDEPEHFIVDISGPKRQWRFFLGKTMGKFRADIRVCPELSRGSFEMLKREAKAALGTGAGNFGGFEEISIVKGNEMPSWVDDLCAGYLPCINEEV